MNKNDVSFMAAVKRVQPGVERPGRPKGAKDTKRRKNPLYKWSMEDLAEKFTLRFHIERTHPTMIRTNDCWIWHGSICRGRGTMVYGSRQDNGGRQPRVQAHRLSYMLHKGDIPEGDLVGQTCGKKLCVNPAHLYLWRR